MIQNTQRVSKKSKTKIVYPKIVEVNPISLVNSLEKKIALETLIQSWNFPPFEEAFESVMSMNSEKTDQNEINSPETLKTYQIIVQEGLIGYAICQRKLQRHNAQITAFILCHLVVDLDFIDDALKISFKQDGLIETILNDFNCKKLCSFVVIQLPKHTKTYRIIRKLKKDARKVRRRNNSPEKRSYLKHLHIFTTPQDFKIKE